MNLLESSFPAELQFLRTIINQIKEHATHYIQRKTKLFRLELACEEVLMNIISHAYPDKGGEINILCRTNGNRFEIVIKDWGFPFNPLTVQKGNPKPLSPKTARQGGLGILLLLHSVDDIQYDRLTDNNVLTLSFQIEPVESSS